MRRLNKIVLIDWTYVPSNASSQNPVKRFDGSAFPLVWEGAEPNEMIRHYLEFSKK
jgi:hypothetical protein